MKKIARILLFVSALAMASWPVALVTGCAGPASVESTAHKTIRATDEAVYTALQVWAERYAQREASNEASRATDPGGYVERRQALLREHGRVVELRAKYSTAVQAAVAAWVRIKESGTAPEEPPATPDVLAIAAELKEVIK